MFVYFSYKSYPYAPAATFLSALCSFLSMLLLGGVLAFGGFAYYWPEKRMTFILLALLCLGLGLFCFLFVYRRAIPRLAEKMTVKNLASRADLAYRYCRETRKPTNGSAASTRNSRQGTTGTKKGICAAEKASRRRHFVKKRLLLPQVQGN